MLTSSTSTKKCVSHLEEAQKQLQHLGQQDFACVPDALTAAEQWNRQLRYHRLSQLEVVPHPYYTKVGRPRKGQAPDGYRYRLQGTLTVKEEVIARARRRAGRFVLATNVLESKTLAEEEMLCEYKGQQGTERGFRFLKDPMFFTSSVFLKTPERVAAKRDGDGSVFIGLHSGTENLTPSSCQHQADP